MKSLFFKLEAPSTRKVLASSGAVLGGASWLVTGMAFYLAAFSLLLGAAGCLFSAVLVVSIAVMAQVKEQEVTSAHIHAPR